METVLVLKLHKPAQVIDWMLVSSKAPTIALNPSSVIIFPGNQNQSRERSKHIHYETDKTRKMYGMVPLQLRIGSPNKFTHRTPLQCGSIWANSSASAVLNHIPAHVITRT
jgi:hypothetical protein